MDVLAVTGDLLTGSTSPYARWYAVLGGGDGVGGGVIGSGEGGEEDAQHQAETNELLRLRLTAYLRLRRHVDLAREVERLNLLDEHEEEVDPAADPASTGGGGAYGGDGGGGRRELPVWVDMTVTILAATSLLYTDPGNPQRCLDVLHRLRVEITNTGRSRTKTGATTSASSPTSSRPIRYLNRIDVAIANVHMRRREWRLALGALDDVVRNIDGGVELEIERRVAMAEAEAAAMAAAAAKTIEDKDKVCDWLRTALSGAARIEIRSRQGWVFLQSGAIPEAEKMFGLADRDRPAVEDVLRDTEAYAVTNPNHVLVNGLAGTALVRHSPACCLTNDGLRLLAIQEYEAAMQRFTDAMRHLQRDHDAQDTSAAAAPPYHDEEEMSATIGFGSEGVGGPGPSLIAPCLNNLALCALYTCRMHHAVAMMESLVREGPTMFLTERLAFNLCTLYELGSDGPASERKKRVLQLVSKRFFLHDIGSESFRIS